MEGFCLPFFSTETYVAITCESCHNSNSLTLDLLALISFKLQHSQLVSLWKFSHCRYKKWYSHFYICQIKISEIWHQFEKNEKICQIALTYRKIKNKYQKASLLVRPQRVTRGGKRFKNRHFWEFSFNFNSFFEVSSILGQL